MTAASSCFLAYLTLPGHIVLVNVYVSRPPAARLPACFASLSLQATLIFRPEDISVARRSTPPITEFRSPIEFRSACIPPKFFPRS